MRRRDRLGFSLPVSRFPLRGLNSCMPCGGSFRIPVSVQEFAGSPKFYNASLHACHALRWTPAVPRGPHHGGPSVLASDAVKTVADCSKRNDGAVSSFGEYGLSCGLHVSLCTLQLTCSVFTSAVAVATLGRSGWLILTPQGLSPCKKRQASLGALTASRSAANRARGSLGFRFTLRAARRLQRGV